MRFLGAVALLVVSTTTAAADSDASDAPGRELNREPDVYISSGAITGSDHFRYGGVVIEAGRRVGRLRETPLFIRGMAHAGNTRTTDNPGRGSYVEARAGIEGRNCTRTGMLCASVGLDVGLHRGRYTRVEFDDNGRPLGTSTLGKPVAEQEQPGIDFENFDSTVIAPRLTLDGGNRVRVRAVLERPYHITRDGGVGGIAGSLMLGVAF